MLSVLRVHLPSDIPIVGCELSPYVLLRRPDQTVFADDVPESSPVEGHFLRYKWYRIQSDKKVAICSIHPSEQATLQCLGCVKAKIPVAKSYHCSPKCFSDAWQHHRVLHERAASAVNENGNEEEEIFGRFSNNNNNNNNINQSLSNGASTPLYPAAVTQRNGGETWFEVGRFKTYTPSADDIGHVLKFECVVIDVESKSTVGSLNTVLTSRVIPAPSPSPRRLVSVSNADVAVGNLDSGTFTVLSYNILSDTFATGDMFGYCPSWALSWPYRRQNLLQEIVGYQADIVCLQEIQSDHFEEFFAPELDKHGYQALYKKKTTEEHKRTVRRTVHWAFSSPASLQEMDFYCNNVFNGSIMTIDGCATFFRRDRFSHVKKYEVEFNKAAQSLTDALVPSAQKKTALNRLVKDNVALIVVLEAKFSNYGVDNPGKRQLVCVANTHVNVQQDLKDVKLWQVHTLLKGLEKIAASADIPMLVCGDFNSVPGRWRSKQISKCGDVPRSLAPNRRFDLKTEGDEVDVTNIRDSAPHALLAIGKVDPMHPDLAVDPLGILRPITKLTHTLPLVSAYSSFARIGDGGGLGYEQQKKRVDPATNEPLFTNCTRNFNGTLDYIFYSADSLTVESLLELLDEDSLRKDTALPSPEWSSDHIALMAEFRCKPRTRR